MPRGHWLDAGHLVAVVAVVAAVAAVAVVGGVVLDQPDL